MIGFTSRVLGCLCLVWIAGCAKDEGEAVEGSTSGSTGISGGSLTTAPSTTATTMTATTASSMSDSETSDPSVSTTQDSETTEATTVDPDGSASATDGTGNDSGGSGTCDGDIYACGDGKDNDGDGNTDLFDPECTGPCDDDESSFQTGLPGDNMDCKQDCFFDGNSGQGDDGCIWDLRCDPENPGGNIGCEYTGGNNCNNQPPNQSEDCIMFCAQYVPPGCDCFGCCEVQTPDGPVHIFLNSGPDCSLDNLDGCESCTYQVDDCGNPCVPEKCQVCFGEDEPPEGCDEGECAIGDPCQGDADCPTDFYCLLGCCYPPPPG